MRNVHVLGELVQACWQLMGLVWLLAAAYYAARRPAGLGGRLLHFVRTLVPEPFLLVAIPMALIAIRMVPKAVWGHLVFVNPALQVAGALLLVASTLFVIWGRLVLGSMWAGKPMVQEGHALRTDGPYRFVRHPIYSGLAGMTLGSAMALGWGELLAILAGVLLMVAWRVWSEERLMMATFGERYREYRRLVPALVPSLRRPAG
jgi:protein-S-isoprenylcysteine O-methyltransferase Ste14